MRVFATLLKSFFLPRPLLSRHRNVGVGRRAALALEPSEPRLGEAPQVALGVKFARKEAALLARGGENLALSIELEAAALLVVGAAERARCAPSATTRRRATRSSSATTSSERQDDSDVRLDDSGQDRSHQHE